MEGLDGVTNQHTHQQRCVWRAQPQCGPSISPFPHTTHHTQGMDGMVVLLMRG